MERILIGCMRFGNFSKEEMNGFIHKAAEALGQRLTTTQIFMPTGRANAFLEKLLPAMQA